MQSIQISNHPQMANIKRFANRHEFSINDSSKAIVLTIKVEHFLESTPEVFTKIQGLNDTFSRLIVDESTRVDATGNIVTDQGIMSEWEFFNILGEQDIKMNDLMRAKILWADTNGRLDIY